MLVLTRKLQEKIHIGENITITVVKIKGNTVRVGIEAPGDVRVVRAEVAARDEVVLTGDLPTDDDTQTAPPPAGQPCRAVAASCSANVCNSRVAPRRPAPLAHVASNRPRLRLALADVRTDSPAAMREPSDAADLPPALTC